MLGESDGPQGFGGLQPGSADGGQQPLMRAAPAFLSAENLLEQAWDEHTDPFTNAVFITISRLRRKLGEPPAIETRPGVGYRITDPGTAA